ncbi:MAG: type II secretion system protein [Verrucomicrobiia bacterium]
MKKINKSNRNMAQKGFTLIEMIGVLAVIAILAGMLIPKIFEAMRNSRINATLEAYNTLKAAVVDNIAKWGKIATTAGTAYTSGTSFDSILFQEGRIDGRAADKIPISTSSGTANVYVNVTAGTGAAAGSGYYLAGATGGNSTANAAAVVELIVRYVAAQDAQDLSMRLDGPALSVTTLGAADTIGRVVYSAATGGKTDVYMYITHQ